MVDEIEGVVIMEHQLVNKLNNTEVTDSGAFSLEELLQGNANNEVMTLNPTLQNDKVDYQQIIQDSIKELNEVLLYAKVHKKVPLDLVNKKIIPGLSNMLHDLDLSRLFIALQGKDNYTLHHSIAVGILSALIGNWLKLSERDRESLILAGLLHDIGKTLIPLEILNKPEKLLPGEYEVMKKHTILGYQILKNTVGVSHRQALVALEHHERTDGSGYPLHLKGDRISQFGRIVAVADVFHAMSTHRVYHDALPIYYVLDELQQGLFGYFDPSIVSVFMKNMMEFLIGSHVQLSNGQIGEIIWINPVAPLRPLVRINDEFIDLNANPLIYIKELLGE